jgi:thiol:disulfide interchange protein DsbC
MSLAKRLLTLIALLAAGAAHASEAQVKKAMKALFNEEPTSITKSGYGGLYEVYADGEVVYTDEKGSFVIVGGSLLDVKSKKNVTRERLAKLSAVKFSDLPLESAIKTVRGKGTRVFATFEDPNCGYCKRFAKDLQKLDDITMYTFVYPILSPDSTAKAKAIWCADSRLKAWNDWMIDGVAPKGDGKCDNPIDEVAALGRKLKINGTPTLILSNGERIGGAVPVTELDKRLKEVKDTRDTKEASPTKKGP